MRNASNSKKINKKMSLNISSLQQLSNAPAFDEIGRVKLEILGVYFHHKEKNDPKPLHLAVCSI